MPANELVLITVGNSRTKVAGVRDGKLEPARAVANADQAALHAAVREGLGSLATGGSSAHGRVLLASVNDAVADPLAELALNVIGAPRLVRLVASPRATGVPIPMAHELPEPVTVGSDRLLNALGAYARAKEPCVVIDAGTAVTVDLVNSHGVFEGGVIAPGLATMLWSLHERTFALPDVPVPRTRAEVGTQPLGVTTPSAILLGCVAAVRGLARLQIDRYAERLGAYPRVIATGGDAALVFEDDDLIEHIVPDLTLVGMLAAWGVLSGTNVPEPAGEDLDADDEE